MDENKFTNILSRAQQLMLDENFNRIVEQKSKALGGSGGGMGNSDISALEASVFGFSNSEPTQPVQMIQPSQPQMIAEQKKGVEALPEFMRESFIKTPPITGDRLGKITEGMVQQQQAVQQVPQRQMVSETVIPNVGGGIDYSLIKAIIDESVSRQLKSLNESAAPTMKGMRFLNGNTFQFVDNKGNLYEGVLKLKKRANQ